MTKMTGGDALTQALISEGTETVFGIPGVQLDGLTDGMYRRQDEVRLMVPRHEQSTTYMADGYHRVTGRPGVAMVVPGPGVLNAGAGMATAYACSSQVMLLSRHDPQHPGRRGTRCAARDPEADRDDRGAHEVDGQADPRRGDPRARARGLPADAHRASAPRGSRARTRHPARRRRSRGRRAVRGRCARRAGRAGD